MKHPAITRDDFDRYYGGTFFLYQEKIAYVSGSTGSPAPLDYSIAIGLHTLLQNEMFSPPKYETTETIVPVTEFFEKAEFIAPQYGYIDCSLGAAYCSLVPHTQFHRSFSTSRFIITPSPRWQGALILTKLLFPCYLSFREAWDFRKISPYPRLPLSKEFALGADSTFYYKERPIGRMVSPSALKVNYRSQLLIKILKLLINQPITIEVSHD